MSDTTAAESVTLDELRDAPYEVLARLRAEAPVAWVPALGCWLVTRRDLALEVLRDADTFTVDDERFSTRLILGENMLTNDGDEHARHRAAFAAWFRPSAVAEDMGPWLDQRGVELVGELPAAFDATVVARQFAIETIVEFFGLDGADSAAVWEWYGHLAAAFEAYTEAQPIPASALAAFDHIDDVVAATRASVPDGLLAAVGADGDLTDDELVANVAVSMFGAIETSEAMTANVVAHLASHPDLFATVRTDRTLVRALIDESLRLEPAVNIVDRYTTVPILLGGVELPVGSFVSVSLLAANRDPDTFDHPDRFDLGRPNSRSHLSFVQGPHMCLGVHLARAETSAIVNALLDRFDGFGLAPGADPSPRGWVFRKPHSVMIEAVRP